ncbi:hypothetical protein BT93_B2626 [Corymbia citriodora subsp. variegata]|nr:hypothetical protein BT93_B2626 [Corymbia citriodora subsp. variegata]
MATGGAKAPGEDEEVVDDEWQFVHSPDSPPSLRLPSPSPSSTRWDTTGDGVGRDDSLQLQHRRSPSVFPPRHHESLERLPPPPPTHQPASPPPFSSPPSSPSSSSSSPPPSNGTENEPPPPPPSRPPGGILWSGVHGIASRVRHCVLFAGGFWSFGSAAAAAGVVAAAAVLLSLAYARMRRRRWRWWRRDRVPVVEASENRLLLLIRDKDQKISQLLLQIAQMNELMLARRRVQVLRVSG